MVLGAITLEDNVGVALNTIILPGVFVGGDSFIGANSVLFNQDFTENSLIFGSPAKRKGCRFESKSDARDDG